MFVLYFINKKLTVMKSLEPRGLLMQICFYNSIRVILGLILIRKESKGRSHQNQ